VNWIDILYVKAVVYVPGKQMVQIEVNTVVIDHTPGRAVQYNGGWEAIRNVYREG
jgi:hypothetical protein